MLLFLNWCSLLYILLWLCLNVIQPVFRVCEQQRCRPAGPSAQSYMYQAFVIHLLESIISRLAMSEIYIFWLVSVAEQAFMNLTV